LISKLVPPHCEADLLENDIDIHHFVAMTPEEMKSGVV
jgi:glycogen synthase kinase 3 beta